MTGMQAEQHWWRREARATVALAYPLVLTNLAQALIPATDVVLLGWVGPKALAAGALGVNLFNACMIFGVGLMIAASPMIARALGQRSHNVRDVRRTVRQALWTAVAVVIPIWLLLWHAGAILHLFRQDPELSRMAQELVRPMMFGMLPLFGYQVLKSFVSALERPGWAFAVGVVAVISNALINYGLIFGRFGLPQWGLFGAGLGSTISNTVMFGGLAVVVMRHRIFRRYHLFGHFWRADWPRFVEVWRLGLPIAVTLGMEVTIFNAAVFLMGIVGTAALAAHAVAIQIASFTFMVPLGLSQAATVRVGLALGRRDAAGITRAGWTAWTMGVGFMTLAACLLWTTPRTFVGLFLDTHSAADAAVVQLAISFLAIAAIFQIVDGAQAVGAGMLRGLHDTKIPMLFAGFGYWVVGLGVALWLGFHRHMGGVGIWIGLASGLAVVAVLMLARWLRRDAIGLTRFG
jgi:MATE family multidrug resistance protein